ncbi:GNAT family N-acetyltransferase [Enterococcus raffinosus]|uniref:GNAT family N-acetyltransferase n=1 Tax=Enterococcus raffinosus TaxID=71452 RepID=A0AAW8T6S2_9ENTE|nr:GNAT family N-acetyltransferase [Enterococcus raffinosus]MDT2523429.1 GNAT family N-acetyltransferase [Enterococcus raffinosus]MDT2530135.1 GNAT family N-acetyltransferase [Enterococcus raffinosus]MDT2532394.1 GNAT family N-acetyltransferase [Enterococcus raffinosus]MDT2544206.1 GNAT family N-acetyltransferase [Enterococcus raffinosus]MDT2555314.1 GNAT family N-acetyltransferase [Enterococcus raffinosus]
MNNCSLGFRKISIEDFYFLKSILQNRDLMLLGWGKIYSDNEVEDWIYKINQQYETYGYSYFIVDDLKKEKAIGNAGIIKTNINSIATDEIAYIVKKDFQGRGYGIKITQKLVNLAFNNYNLSQIVAQIVPENVASQKFIHELGMTYQFSYNRNQNGILKKHLVYLLKNESKNT